MGCEINHGSRREAGQFDDLLTSGMTLSSCLLGQKANVCHDVLHFSVSELAAPGMHRAEDNTVLDRSQ